MKSETIRFCAEIRGSTPSVSVSDNFHISASMLPVKEDDSASQKSLTVTFHLRALHLDNLFSIRTEERRLAEQQLGLAGLIAVACNATRGENTKKRSP